MVTIVIPPCALYGQLLMSSMAPELIMGLRVTNKVDVYSFGCIVNVIITEKMCYSDIRIRNQTDVVVRVVVQYSSLPESVVVFTLRSSLTRRMVCYVTAFKCRGEGSVDGVLQKPSIPTRYEDDRGDDSDVAAC